MTDNGEDLEAEVMRVRDSWSRALWDKDLECFPYFANRIGTEREDIELTVSSELAFVTFLSRPVRTESDNPSAKSWLRTSVCLKKLGDGWKVIRDHISLPVDCGAEKPTYILDEPEAGSADSRG